MIADYYRRTLPEYSRWMCLAGYAPEVIMQSWREKMRKQMMESEKLPQITIESKVQIKR